jgi:GTP-binding protein Era
MSELDEMQSTTRRCGYIGVIGRPNAGKSTLLNAVLGKKLVITSRKAQTTRHAILGIKTHDNIQAIYVDTPGYRDVAPGMLHKHLNRAAAHAAFDVDVLVWVVDVTRYTSDDDAVLDLIKRVNRPVILVLNKIDLIKAKYDLLPVIKKMQGKYDFLEIVPLSSTNNDNVAAFEKALEHYLPQQDFMYAAEQISDRPNAFFYAEIIREKVMRFLGEEVPYSVAVEIERVEEEQGLLRISALLWTERDGQKAIIIGEDGETLKHIGTEARIDIEAFASKKVFLKLWVKVKEDWSRDQNMIKSLGYE